MRGLEEGAFGLSVARAFRKPTRYALFYQGALEQVGSHLSPSTKETGQNFSLPPARMGV